MSASAHLFSPVRIGALELRNRLVMSPMETGYASRDGVPSERTIAYYEARARGGVGLITLGACTVDTLHREVPRTIDLARDDPAALEAHRELTARVHAAGAAIQPQLAHPGPDGLAPYLSHTPNVGPSVVPSYLTGIACRELAAQELPAIAQQFAAAAARAREAGYDGIELHAAHGYMLLGSFLSPLRNRRTDAYDGTSDAGRIRLVVEVVRAIKRAAGADFPLTLRLSGSERVAGGRQVADTARIAPALVAAGVDAFHVSGGVIDRLTTQMVAGSHYPDAHNLAAAEALRQVVDVPVMTVGRIHDPALAERIVREQRADLVVMGRPLLADPDLPRKAFEGRTQEIRRCISCQSCIDSMERGPMACAVNPFTGREAELRLEPATVPRRVLVVGGGPAGLECARLAALRGHRVALYDRAERLGGALLAASAVHAENRPLLDQLLEEVARLPIDIHLGRALDAEAIGALAPDVAIVATGGRVVTPDFGGAAPPHVIDALRLRALLATGTLSDAFGHRVAVVGASLAGLQTAQWLAGRGHRVVVLESEDEIAPEVGAKRRAEHLDRLDGLGVPVRAGAAIERIVGEGLIADGRTIAADCVVLAGRVEAERTLYDALEGRVSERHAIGDCTGFGLIAKAIGDAARVACSL